MPSFFSVSYQYNVILVLISQHEVQDPWTLRKKTNENTFLSEAASVRMFYSSNRRVGEDKAQDQVSPVTIIAEIPERLGTVS